MRMWVAFKNVSDLMLFHKCICAVCLSASFLLPSFQKPAGHTAEGSFISPDGRFAFKYSNSLIKCERDPKQPDQWIPNGSCEAYIPVCTDAASTPNATVVCIAYPAEGFSGTNFEVAAFSVNQLDGVTAEECQRITEPRPVTPRREKINGVTFDVFDVSGVAAGNLLAADAYRSFHRDRCYELGLRVAMVSMGNFDPGTVKEFDHEAVNRSLKSALNTFTLVK